MFAVDMRKFKIRVMKPDFAPREMADLQLLYERTTHDK
jgi:hypothetical protein